MMADCVRIFERLPIVEEVQLLRNILYSGVWIRFQAAKEKRIKVKSKKEKTVADPYKILGVSRDASDEEIKKHIGH